MLDGNGDGEITKKEAGAAVRRRWCSEVWVMVTGEEGAAVRCGW